VSHAQENPLLAAKTVNSSNATVTVRSQEYTAAPVVAYTELVKAAAVEFTGNELKYPVPSGAKVRVSRTEAGAASDYKLVWIQYKGTTSGADVESGDTGSFDEGYRELAAADHKGVIDKDVYNVKARIMQIDPLKQGYGLYEDVSAVFTVGGRDLSKVRVAVNLAAASTIYNGTVWDVGLASGRTTVTDGSKTLSEGDDYTFGTQTSNWTDAGTHTVVIVPGTNGNYSGTVSGTFTVTQKTVSIKSGVAYNFTKQYDGTTAIDTGSSWTEGIEFDGLVGTEVIGRDGYTLKDLKYGDKAVGDNKTVTADVALVASDEIAKNYKLSNAKFSVSGQKITKGPVTAASLVTKPELSVETPRQVKKTGKAITVAVSWASGLSGVNAKDITVNYGTEGNVAPVEVGDYTITADVAENSSFLATEGVALGTLSIVSALQPTVTVSPTEDVYYHIGSTLTLTAVGLNPDGKATGITYQWYEQTEEGLAAMKGKTSAKLALSEKTVGNYIYVVRAVYKSSDQEDTYRDSEPVSVQVRPEPVDIKNVARIEINAAPVYTASP